MLETSARHRPQMPLSPLSAQRLEPVVGPTVCASASLNTMIKTIRERPCTLAGGSWHLGTFVKRFAGTFVKRFVRSLAVFHHGTGKKD